MHPLPRPEWPQTRSAKPVKDDPENARNRPRSAGLKTHKRGNSARSILRRARKFEILGEISVPRKGPLHGLRNCLPRSLLGLSSGCHGYATTLDTTLASARSRGLTWGHKRAAKARSRRRPAPPGDRLRPDDRSAVVALVPPRRASLPAQLRVLDAVATRNFAQRLERSLLQLPFRTLFTLQKFHPLNQRRSAHQG